MFSIHRRSRPHSARWQTRPVEAEGVHGFEGRFREVTPPERIVQTFEWDGMPAHVVIETIVLEDLGDGRTGVVNTSLFYTVEERDGMLQSGMETGVNQSYAALDRVLAAMG
jgi:uncharacterized protein YndB with AHSA1/START domain